MSLEARLMACPLLMMVVKKFNVRQLQAYAGVCLWQFCKHLGVKHGAIAEQILHLISMLSANSLPEWERKGASLAITGRGEILPQEVIDLFEKSQLKIFSSLVEFCVEVGIVDMYGASTEQPLEFLKKSIQILQQVNAALPESKVLADYQRGSDKWGDPIGDAEVGSILEAYDIKAQ